MEEIKTRLKRGLNGWQIKMIAVLFMTIDHLGAYGFEIPVFDTYNSKLRLLGRIAMPLFLFMLTEGLRHTRSRGKFLLRLYFGAVWTGLFVSVTNFLFGDTIGYFVQSNILFTYLYVALYVTLLEQLIHAAATRNWKTVAFSLLGIAATVLPHYIWELLYDIEGIWMLDFRYMNLCTDLINSFVCSPLYVEYTPLFVAMGVLMYFAGTKQRKALVLVLFSILSFVGVYLPVSRFHSVFGYPQYYMILAVPFLLLYNGEKGRSDKYFFYLYYPLHRYAISIVVYVYQLFCGV